MKPTIVGIYSYPKSGNTWVRQVVGNFFKLRGYEALRVSVPDIAVEPFGDNIVQHENQPYLFYKSHSWYEITQSRGHSFENDVIIHIRRNPLDVFVSHLNYLSGNLHDAAPVKFKDVDDCTKSGLIDHYFGAFLTLGQIDPRGFGGQGTYFGSNLWWTTQANESQQKRIFSVRYEDLLEDFTATLGPAWTACGLPENRLKISADTIKQRIQPDGKFYWKMQRGNYLEYLDRNKIEDFVKYHRDELARLDYLDMILEDIGT
ncbi:sulfotransferase [Kordiimonas aestuarii]|uniref:sulfotransferase n=1 Tax=Kordiimonas aestuarii TaxID=1005925 RepID=UPI0021D11944|nr:sulfotransferase [Kordiimonas aestuarii]